MSDSAKSEPIKWDVPAIDGTPGGQFTAGALQDLQKQAYNEAFEQGRAEGIAAGEQQVQERAERLDQLLASLSRPFEQLDEAVEKQLVELAMTMVKALFRRELRLDPTHVIGVVRDAVGMLPMATRDVRVHLHPDDASLVRESLTQVEGEQAWTIVEDPLITRGGCSVSSDNSCIDAQAETRVNELINAIAGDERQ